MSQRYIFLRMASARDPPMEHPFYGMPPSMARRHTTALDPPKRLCSIGRASSSSARSSGDLRGLSLAPQELLQHRASLPGASRVQDEAAFASQEKAEEEEDQDNGSDVMTTMNEDEEHFVYDDAEDGIRELQEEEDEADDHDIRLSKETMFLVAAWVVLFTSGGLILGFGPIYSTLVQEKQWSDLCPPHLDGQRSAAAGPCAQQEIRLQYVFSTSFLCLSAANAFFGVLLDIIGPRWTAVLGLALAVCGNVALSYGDSHAGTGIWIILGYSMIGAGGMGSYLAAFQILQLYQVQGFVCSTLSSLFNCSGYIYMILQVDGVTRRDFFLAYSVLVFVCLIMSFLLFPTNSITKARDWVRIPGFQLEMLPMNTPRGLLDGMKVELQRPDLWYFALFFGWISLIFAFAGGAIPSMLVKLAGEDPASGSLFINVLYPVLVNGTFMYSPLVGYAIDRYGFKVIFVASLALVQLFIMLLLVPSLRVQVLMFFVYAMAQACVYALQFAYTMMCFPPELYGTLQAFLATISFSFGLLNYLITPWTQMYFGGDYTVVLLALAAPTFVLFCFVDIVKGCEDQTIGPDSHSEETELSKLI